MSKKRKWHKARAKYDIICYFDRKSGNYFVEILGEEPSRRQRIAFANLKEAIAFIESRSK